MDPGTGRFAEDFTVGEETELGSYLVSRDELVDFARKYDPFPFHLDEEAAVKKQTGTRLCAPHGEAVQPARRVRIGHDQHPPRAVAGA